MTTYISKICVQDGAFTATQTGNEQKQSADIWVISYTSI